MLDDTIAAVATPPGRGGIGVVRVSGPGALDVARALLRSSDAAAFEANRAFVADVVSPDGEAIDHVVATCFHSPRSFTGEHTVEISCHGSPVVLELVLHAALRAGARLATPGEFTLRAFLNGRLDLTQAEAVRDLVDAQTGYQARRAQRQLRGELSRRLQPLKERLLDVIVHLESTVEFVEDEIEPESRSALSSELAAASADVRTLTRTYDLGRRISEGVSLAFVGPPNAGKSSLFNALLERERAIVTAIPGTTRDLVSETLVLGGLPFRLVDTAGLRDTHDEVERIGIDRTRGAMADADIVLVVLDASATTREAALVLLEETEGLRRVVVENKIDLVAGPRYGEISVSGAPLRVSALTGEGIDVLRAAVLAVATEGGDLESTDILVTNARHHAILARASEHLDEARRALDEGLSEEFALVGLHAALGDLGELTGETAIDDILNRIFSTFCIGK